VTLPETVEERGGELVCAAPGNLRARSVAAELFDHFENERSEREGERLASVLIGQREAGVDAFGGRVRWWVIDREVFDIGAAMVFSWLDAALDVEMVREVLGELLIGVEPEVIGVETGAAGRVGAGFERIENGSSAQTEPKAWAHVPLRVSAQAHAVIIVL